MSRLITAESVSYGHPDKVADQISDAILDGYLKEDPSSKVAVETLVKDNMVVIGGEVKSSGIINHDTIIRSVVKDIGYTDSEHGFYYKNITIINLIGKQSPEINTAVEANSEELGAGDQGFMTGYATDETENYMPLAMNVSKKLVDYTTRIHGLGPDVKTQTTIEECDDGSKRIHTILISTMHLTTIDVVDVRTDLTHAIMSNKVGLYNSVFRLIDKDTKIVINPAGSWNVGGPVSDCGVTGRKIVVDQYGPYCPVGGGAFCFSGDTKVKTDKGYKEISTIKEGDKVFTLNEDSEELELKEVNEVYSKSIEDSYDMLELTLENGEVIKITKNHEVKTERGWIKAKDLNMNDHIIRFSDLE